jgi:uncharacterized protein YndB with AHSA1/START domain
MFIALDVGIAATPEVVFEALTGQIGAWWTMTFKTPAVVMLEAWPGGRFFETWADGSEIEYARVTRVKPGVVLAMSGAMGLSGDIDGEIVFTLAGTSRASTVLHLAHRASGPLDEGTEDHYRLGWSMLLERVLKPFVESRA